MTLGHADQPDVASQARDADPNGSVGCESARLVADAVLYEGYLLYPYRTSSEKNRVRWQFGVLAPRDWIEARGLARDSVAGSADTWRQRTECLLEVRASARLRVRLRFLQLQHRSVRRRGADGGFVEVGELDVDGQRHLTFDEAVPQEFDVAVQLDDLDGREHTELITVPGGEDIESLGSAGDSQVVRIRWPLSARLRLSISDAPAPFPLRRLRVDIGNAVTDQPADVGRTDVLRRCLIATHCLLSVRDGAFLSQLDPPAWADAAAKDCRNLHTFPVLAGDNGGRDVVLSSPIIMYDHPGVAPESPGDLHDACEIDEILTLRTLTLTDEEKREARATDPRAKAIVDRADVMPKEVFARLHGAVRSLRPVCDGLDAMAEPPAVPRPTPRWWDPGADHSSSPGSDAVVVDGVRVARGSRVRLHPRSTGTDAHDMFLRGRTARVEAVLLDVDDDRHVAVVLDDDPGADLHQWYGRYHYFAPEELTPLDAEAGRK
jgi:hypothetical protein